MTTVAPLRIRRFRSLWIASLFSNLGSFLHTVAASWLMLEMTQSATWVGLIQASTTLPLLFFALAAGALADLVDRTRVVLISQIVMGAAAVALAVITELGAMTPPLLVIIGLVLGSGVAFNLPSWQALVPNLVPAAMLSSAVALNSAGFNVARAVGPALGGILVAAAGAGVAFGINALSFVGVIVVVAVLSTRLHFPEPEHSPMRSAIAIGARFVRFTPEFSRLLALLALFALGSAVVQAVLPSRTEELGGDAGVYGLLLGLMGAGALAGALSRRRVDQKMGWRLIPTTVALFGVGGVIVGLAPNVPVAGVGILLSGACWVWTLITLNTTSQVLSPDWVRGRAMSFYTLAFTGILPLGSIIAGVLADAIGAGMAMVVLSTGTVVLGLVTPFFRIPTLGELEPLTFDDDPTGTHQVLNLDGGPVMILNTWVVAEEKYEEFIEVMQRIRMVRLRTGAYRWRLYRNASDPHRLTEIFLTTTWEEHIAQHGRIDDAARRLLRHARSFDVGGDPTARHLIGMDIIHPPEWNDTVGIHDELHKVDGSVPIDTGKSQ
ncbi:MAG: MFS transporter [Acidimicrobiia bacterium]|nr:MFS transporter [Acidimicrobiia bacterium]